MITGRNLTEVLNQKIRQMIRANVSLRHVPVKIIEVPVIPYTLNMKKIIQKQLVKKRMRADFFGNP